MPKKKDEGAVRLGRKGGLATARNLTPAQRSEKARKAGLARWKTPRKSPRRKVSI